MNILIFGGGTGTSATAPQFLRMGVNRLTVVVTVFDDGGSTGTIREETGLPGMGDARKVISSFVKKRRYSKTLETRGGDGDCVGNRLLAAHMGKSGVEEGIAFLGRNLMRPGCEVIPVSEDSCELVALLSDGTYLRKECEIGGRPETDERMIEAIRLEPRARATQTVLDRIRDADLIIFGPGSLFTSIVPNLVVDGVREALSTTRAKLALVVNLFTNPSETRGYNATDFARVIANYIGRKLHLVLCNDASKMSSAILGKYLEEQGSEPIHFGPEQKGGMSNCTNGVIVDDLLDKSKPSPARHSRKAADIVFDWYSLAVAAEALVPAEETCQTV